MLAIDLDSADNAKAVVAQLLEQGILINRTHDTVLRFLPPYIIEKKHVDEVINALDRALRISTAHVGPDALVRAGELRSPVAARGAAGRVRAPAPTRSVALRNLKGASH
jgi:hypothetical protein